MERFAERVMHLVAVEESPPRGSKIRAAWIAVSLHVTVRLTLAVWFAKAPHLLLPLPALLFALGLRRRFMRPAAVLFTLVQCARFALSFPDVSNHYLVECLAVAAFAAVDLSRDEEQLLGLGMLRWLAVLVLFMSGLQKLLHGAYFHGQYLGYMVGNTDRFRAFFGPILPAVEVARLQSLAGAAQGFKLEGDHIVGALPGPFRVGSLPFVAISNAVWLGELVVAVGLLWRRVRRVAFVASLLLMAGILGSSHEFFFDTLFLNLLLLFAPSDLNWKLLPLSLVSYGYYLLVGFDVLKASFVW
jgi:hypothetical protein